MLNSVMVLQSVSYLHNMGIMYPNGYIWLERVKISDSMHLHLLFWTMKIAGFRLVCIKTCLKKTYEISVTVRHNKKQLLLNFFIIKTKLKYDNNHWSLIFFFYFPSRSIMVSKYEKEYDLRALLTCLSSIKNHMDWIRFVFLWKSNSVLWQRDFWIN